MRNNNSHLPFLKGSCQLAFVLLYIINMVNTFDAIGGDSVKRRIRRPGGAVNTLLNTTFYLGKTYEYAYNKYYWTIGMVRFFNSTLNNETDIFTKTSYIFFENEWAGSKEHPMIFKIDPVSFISFKRLIIFF